jgi:hypothetical protein
VFSSESDFCDDCCDMGCNYPIFGASAASGPILTFASLLSGHFCEC